MSTPSPQQPGHPPPQQPEHVGSLPAPATPAERAALAAQLADELAGLRDALVRLSLALKDWQFELDAPARAAARRQLAPLLQAFRDAPLPRRPPRHPG